MVKHLVIDDVFVCMCGGACPWHLGGDLGSWCISIPRLFDNITSLPNPFGIIPAINGEGTSPFWKKQTHLIKLVLDFSATATAIATATATAIYCHLRYWSFQDLCNCIQVGMKPWRSRPRCSNALLTALLAWRMWILSSCLNCAWNVFT